MAQGTVPVIIRGQFLYRPGAPRLFLRAVEPDRATDARARLLLVHASMVHSEYYLPMAARLAAAGVAVWMVDLRGHGRSGGARGHVQHWGQHVADVSDGFHAMTADVPAGTPCLLAGESYGGLITYLNLQEQRTQPEAAMLLSPALGLTFRLTHAQRWWIQSVGRRLLPWIRPPRPLGHEGIAQDPFIGDLIDSDTMAARHYTLGFLANLLDAQDAAQSRPAPAARPLLALLSDGDGICDNQVPLRLFRGHPSITTRCLPGPRHSLVADMPDRVADEVLGWLGCSGLLRPGAGVPT
jgi:alpha-beta hydrolase superfamily lysophospholipase